jgi:4-hydroxybenzoate polyprenyltransferase
MAEALRRLLPWPFEGTASPSMAENLLLFLPALAGHEFSGRTLIPALIAFVSFSFGASSMYALNDWIDLPHDRAHPEKRHRPFAAGIIPANHAVILSLILAAISVALAFILPRFFVLCLATYFCLALSYSFYLKRKLMIDVVALAGPAASACCSVVTELCCLSGSAFCFFFQLILMKRTTEIIPCFTRARITLRTRLSAR